MNILVTGGAGFIGSQIAEAYLKQGFKVVVVDDLSSGKREQVPAGAEFYPMNILDPEIEGLFSRHKIQAVNHHAAQISVNRSVADPMFDANSNIIGALHLLKISVKSKVEKFVFASTGGAIYGNQLQYPADESHRCEPCSPYGIAKHSVEHYLRFFNETHGLHTVALRYSNVFGPRQDPHGEAGVVAIFCKRLLNDQPLLVYGDGEQTRDFVFVKDIVRANQIALQEDCSGIFNVGTGIETTVNHIARSLVQLAGKSVEIEHASARPGEQSRSCIDPGLFSSQFDWRPSVNLEDGLFETYDYFKQTANANR
ncbi:MAG: NAD-dependent epimerase/dehydratase family protein [Candidatus Nitrohelix vancouverensis]|uniref:NAD-dependent epimerase/dehydratase family protein n=1 Tax=Candidatus Nitrohelix vancouverensis TaxID=2705534 RepID=A0A7T0C315_9BACT|nr:MAG: NAD-dependent epimerase/dehydratase family protein [Candidatus Nitrohelix vancouverensis]